MGNTAIPTVVSWLMMADLIWMPELVSKKARRRRESQEQQLPLQPPPKNQPLPHSQQQLPLRPQHLQQPQLQQPQQLLQRQLPQQQLLPQLVKARTTLAAATKKPAGSKNTGVNWPSANSQTYGSNYNNQNSAYNSGNAYNTNTGYNGNNAAYSKDNYPAPAAKLSCWTCHAYSMADCNAQGSLVACQSNQESCELEIRERQGKTEQILMGCKQKMACENNKKQNFWGNNPSWTQCRPEPGYTHSVCRQCCETDSCTKDWYPTDRPGWGYTAPSGY